MSHEVILNEKVVPLMCVTKVILSAVSVWFSAFLVLCAVDIYIYIYIYRHDPAPRGSDNACL